jgi:hypothetical protein
MAHKPRALVRNAKHTVDLMSANRGLAGRNEMGSENPFVQRDFGALIDGSDRHSELLATVIAEVQSGPPATDFACMIDTAAMRADGTIRPTDSFQMLASLVSVLKNGIR